MSGMSNVGQWAGLSSNHQTPTQPFEGDDETVCVRVRERESVTHLHVVQVFPFLDSQLECLGIVRLCVCVCVCVTNRMVRVI